MNEGKNKWFVEELSANLREKIFSSLAPRSQMGSYYKLWVLSYSNKKKVLLYIMPNFSVLRFTVICCLCFHFSTSNCELMPWCGVTGWPGFKFWYFLLSTLCESITSHLLSLCSVNRSVYPCSTSLPVLLWGSRKIRSIQGFLFCFALFVFFKNRHCTQVRHGH